MSDKRIKNMQIYYIQSCNIWKTTDSIRLIFIGTSKQKIKKFIENEILNQNMTYDDDQLTAKQQCKLFRNDWNSIRNEYDLKTINAKLTYGMINHTENNSEI